MEWGIAIVALVVTASIAHAIGRKSAKREADLVLRNVETAQGHDRHNFLTALLREIGNDLMQRDPWRFVDVKAKALREVERIAEHSKTDAAHEMAVLCKRYPTYDQFAPFTARNHVLYSDSWSSAEELEERYLDIVRFMCVIGMIDPHWPFGAPTDEEDLEHARKYAARISDTRLEHRIRSAYAEYVQYRGDGATRREFETPNFSVTPVSHVAESRYGFHFKDTDEYGIHSTFYGDRIYVSVYRSDEDFESTDRLDSLSGVRLAFEPMGWSPSRK